MSRISPYDFKGKRSSHGFHQWSSPNNRHGATPVPASLNQSLPHKSQHQVPAASASDWENCSCSWQTLGGPVGDSYRWWMTLLNPELCCYPQASNMAVENWWKPPLDGGLKREHQIHQLVKRKKKDVGKRLRMLHHAAPCCTMVSCRYSLPSTPMKRSFGCHWTGHVLQSHPEHARHI